QEQVASDVDVGSVSFCNVVVPKEAVHHILEYLPQYDLCHNVGKSCKSLLVATRVPDFWSKIDDTIRMDYNAALDGRWFKIFVKPQFASLKSLTRAPDLSRDGRWYLPSHERAFELLSLACPQLEELNLAQRDQMFWKDEVEEFPVLFPNLTTLTIPNSNKIEAFDIGKVCIGLGERLLKLVVVGEAATNAFSSFRGRHAVNIAKYCPNLQEFVWDDSTTGYHNSFGSREITNPEVQSILRVCPRMKRLGLFGRSASVGLEAFESVPALGSALTHLLVRYDPRDDMTEQDEEICNRLKDRIPECQLSDGSIGLEPVGSEQRLLKRTWVW
ncbi:MAG: hypothetical protein SGARI_005123, partial [Bacillariaceae sp.]